VNIAKRLLRRPYRYLTRSPFDIAGFDLDESGALRKGCWDGVDSFAEALEQTNANIAVLSDIRSSDDRVLDAGCGLGSTCTYLAENFRCQTVGVTWNEEECKGARSRAERRGVAELTRFEIMDFTETPFESESFDVVLAIESLTWLDDKTRFLTEAFRLLRPGGRLLVVDQYLVNDNPSPFERRIIQRWTKGYGGFKLTTTDRFVSAMEHVGLEDVTMFDWTKNVTPTTSIIFRHSLLWSVNDFLLGVVFRWGRFRRRFAFWSSAQAEFLAFRLGLATYQVVVARKP
jgi:tocopherol O-methyltransferase